MAVKDTRVIVVTNSSAYYGMMRKGMAAQPEADMIIQAKNTGELMTKLNRAQKNFIIIDLDTVSANYSFVSQIVEKYQTVILLTAVSKSLAISLLRGNIRDFLAKPSIFNLQSEGTHVRDALAVMRGATAAAKPLNFHAQQKIVGSTDKIVAIASSTGGPEALEKIFRALPADAPPMVVVQHMPSGFTKLFADRLNSFCQIEIREAVSNDYLQKGLALIAPADLHMIMTRKGSRLMVECYKGTKVHGVMPAADVLFDSIAPIMRKNVMGVVLTGMGADGAIGLKNMRNLGSYNIGQNKETSVVYGMPKVAYELGALDLQVPIDKVAAKIMEWYE